MSTSTEMHATLTDANESDSPVSTGIIPQGVTAHPVRPRGGLHSHHGEDYHSQAEATNTAGGDIPIIVPSRVVSRADASPWANRRDAALHPAGISSVPPAGISGVPSAGISGGDVSGSFRATAETAPRPAARSAVMGPRDYYTRDHTAVVRRGDTTGVGLTQDAEIAEDSSRETI